MLDDDVFEIAKGLALTTPPLLWVLIVIILVSIFLTYLKNTAEMHQSGEDWKLDHPDLPERCCFPLCGVILSDESKAVAVCSKFNSEIRYCSAVCRKRDVNENNHKSVVLMLRYRAEELRKERADQEQERSKSFFQNLEDLVPNPKGMFHVDEEDLCCKISRSVEHDAALLTSRRFAEAYVAKYGLAVHHWTWQCFQRSGKGCVLIHLSERALEHSKGSPLSYVPHRMSVMLCDKKLNAMIREYHPDRQLVLYILQRGIDKRHIAIPLNYTVYSGAPPTKSDTLDPNQPETLDAHANRQGEAGAPSMNAAPRGGLDAGEQNGGKGEAVRADEAKEDSSDDADSDPTHDKEADAASPGGLRKRH